jgi:dTDP-4-dehydrorhamnose reductase
MIKAIRDATDERIVATARNLPGDSGGRVIWSQCDISIRDEVDALSGFLARIEEPVKVIFLAAYHHPDDVRRNPRIAWGINVTSLSYALNRLENVHGLFYVSTDSVYGESEDMYHFTERDGTNPVNIYGRQKAIAEQIVLGYGYNVVRFPFLIGESLVAHKKHFYDNITATLRAGGSVEMFIDSYRSALSFYDATRLFVMLTGMNESARPPILNVCGDDDLSKYDIGLMIADKLGVSRRFIVPLSIGAAEGIFASARAKSTLMDNGLLKRTLGLPEIKFKL